MRGMREHSVALTRHPDTPSAAVRRIGVRLAKLQQARLALSYAIEGEIERLRVPAPRPPSRTDRLWQHTCCEVFIARKDHPGYHEFNFAPSGAWATYAFERYRDGAPSEDRAPEPRLAVHVARDKLELEAEIDLDRLSPLHAEATLSLALAVVIEDQDGLLSYWALRHPPGAPDFHHPHAFALELE